MPEYLEKYYRINMDFPNKAGKLDSVLTAQRRIIHKLMKSKQSPEVQELLVSVAEGIDVSYNLLAYMKETLQEVANDSNAVIEGARLRNTIDFQSEVLSEYMAK